MTEHIYVNEKHRSVRLALPSGSGLDIGLHHAVRGEYFARYVPFGILVPLTAMPRDFKPRVIHDPLKKAAPPAEIRVVEMTDSVSVSSDLKATKRDQEVPANSAAAIAVKREVSMASGPAAPPPEVALVNEAADEPVVGGRSAEDWKVWLRAAADTTVLQTLKLAEMRDVAAFLGIQVEDTSTKVEILQQFRQLL